MRSHIVLPLVLGVCLLRAAGATAQNIDFTGEIALETRFFPRQPLFGDQTGAMFSPSLSLTPEVKYEWGDTWRVSAIGFVRMDAHDQRRTHIDMRQLGLLYLGNKVSAFAGLGKVFWGVMEVNHLVDIINQTDAVEDIDTEDKLGQPMVSLTLEGGWGYLDIYYLPYFRERTFPAGDARLRGPLPVVDKASYFAESGRWHQDFALRWSHQFGALDVAGSFFRGTAREPILVPTESVTAPQLTPFYTIIDQVGMDVQWTRDATLWKFEAITRGGHGERFFAMTGGVERTIYGVAGGDSDLGLLSEVMYDGRDGSAPPTIFNRDIFIGFRWALNDINDTSILGGPVIDFETGEILAFIEAHRRIGDAWRLGFESRVFANTAPGALVNTIRRDSFITIRLSRFM